MSCLTCHLLRGGSLRSRRGDVSEPFSKNGTSPYTVSQNWNTKRKKAAIFSY